MLDQLPNENEEVNEHLTCIDLERNIWAKFSMPMEAGKRIFGKKELRNLHGEPYVFHVDLLNIYDEDHPQGLTQKDVTVIFMHGGRMKGGKWMFSDNREGYPVVETVERVNKYLSKVGKQNVTVVLACNKYPESDTPTPDFIDNKHIIYALGDTVRLIDMRKTIGGQIVVEVGAKRFHGT